MNTQQAELDDCRQRLREIEDREQVERHRREQERKEAAKEAARQAADWPEAFRKQRALIAPELRFSATELAKTGITYDDEADRECDLAFWRDDVAALQADLEMIDAAEQIYAEESVKAQAEIAAIRQRMLATVASRLKPLDKPPGRGFLSELIESLEADDPSAWLNW